MPKKPEPLNVSKCAAESNNSMKDVMIAILVSIVAMIIADLTLQFTIGVNSSTVFIVIATDAAVSLVSAWASVKVQHRRMR
jgi:hypothetical protein